MSLFLQLDLSMIPMQVRDQFGDGLLQLFYCTSCDGGWEPFSRVSLVRIVTPSEFAFSGGIDHVEFAPKLITGWEPLEDHPDASDHDALGLRYTYNFKAKPMTTQLSCDNPAFSIDGILIDKTVIQLADEYQQRKILTPKFYDDGVHIALATIAEADVLVSWNFKHIVKFDKIRLFNAVNLFYGYKPLQIYSPREVTTHADESE